MISAQLLRSVYHQGFEFPEWTFSVLSSKEYSTKAVILYDSKDSLSLIKVLATHREPTNIAGSRLYDRKKMKEYFGWSIGFYPKYWSVKNQLAPNIAAYCLTPVRTREYTFPKVHILSVIGAALDAPGPDLKFFLDGKNEKVVDQSLRKFYVKAFSKVWKCAELLGLSTIVWSLFGCGNFSTEYEVRFGKSFVEKIWIPAFLHTRKKYLVVARGVENKIMGAGRVDLSRLGEIEDVGYFPGCLLRIDISNSLIINAWDPYSIVGNGNEKDESLDGYIGRHSAAGVLTWPISNPDVKYVAV